MIIYKTTNTLNGMFYIGKSIHNRPWYLGSGIRLKNAIRQYGREAFVKEILETCDNEIHLNEREQFWIEKFGAKDKAIAYNIADGGEGGRTLSEEARLARSTAMRGEGNHFYGKSHTNETKQRLRNSKIGSVDSDATKQKKSVGLKKSYASGKRVPAPKSVEEREAKRKRMTEDNPACRAEVKQKISNATQGANNPAAKTWIFTDKSGIEVVVTGGMKEFCEQNGLAYSTMRKIADGRTSTKWHSGWTIRRDNGSS